jgi:hypothetical protein
MKNISYRVYIDESGDEGFVFNSEKIGHFKLQIICINIMDIENIKLVYFNKKHDKEVQDYAAFKKGNK